MWRRSGRVFTMGATRYRTRIAAQKAGERAGLAPDERMVRQCAGCPTSVRSKRKRPARSVIVRRLASAFGVREVSMDRALAEVGL